MKKGIKFAKAVGLILAALLMLAHCGKNESQTGDSSLAGSGAISGTVAQQSGAGGGAGDSGTSGASPTGGYGGSVAGVGGSVQDADIPSSDTGIVPTADATQPNDAAQPDDATSALPAVTDLTAAGPFTAKTVTGCGPNNAYTCYYPEELAKDGVKNPFLTWGNGAGTTPSNYTLLPHLASHGFVIIASNNTGVTADELRAGLDWLFSENERSGSDFYQKLDTSKVASMGYSLGSDGTFKIADDPRLVTTVHISGGAFDKADTARLRNPALFVCGGPGGDGMTTGDIAHDNCDSDFEVTTVPTFYGVFVGGGHLGVLMSPYMERIRVPVTGWLRWRLMGDSTQKAVFVGDQCTLCQDPNWEVQQKNLDQL
jgi:hypothetical protein